MRRMIERETHDDVVVLRLANGRVNTLDIELLTDLAAELGELAHEAPPLVLTGRGSAFSAGVDLSRIVQGTKQDTEAFLHALTTAFRAMFGYPGPTVAAINGHAIAGGFVLAAACDHRIVAAGDARLGLSELRVGVPFPTSAIEIVRHAVGQAVARRLVLGGRLTGPEGALRDGLVDEIAAPADVLPSAIAEAGDRAGRGANAYKLAKRQLQRPAREMVERAGPGEDSQVRAMWTDPEATERIRGFLAGLADQPD